MLLRKLISHRLKAYYSQPSQSVVGGVSKPLRLHWGRFYWLYKYRQLYKQNQGQWLTPVELFQPYYSRIIFRWMREHLEKGNQPQIVELGPGRGTNARILLETIRRDCPNTFSQLRYTLVDSSASLLGLQQETLSNFDEGTVQFCQRDLMHVAQGEQELWDVASNPTILIALEVWDNLPHDKIRVRNGIVEQAEVVRLDTGNPVSEEDVMDQSIALEERFVPLSDPLIQDILHITPDYVPRQGVAWIPSVACGILSRVQQTHPALSILIADFDWLPHGDYQPQAKRRSIPARHGEPIITCMNDIDHPCYLDAPLHSDILFPTDFRLLAKYSRSIWKDTAKVRVDKQSHFLKHFGPEDVRSTTNRISGFSPMTSDFDNCSIMSITPTLL